MAWSSNPPAQPVDPGLAASAAALLSALVREEPRPAEPVPAVGPAPVPSVPQTRGAADDDLSASAPASWTGLPAEQTRRWGLFGRR